MLEDRFVSVDNSKIHYIECGGGPPVVLFHGSSFNARTWEETGTLKAIADAGFRAISVDLPGKGLSDQGSFSQENTAEFIKGFLKALGVKKPVLIGASLGGFVAMDFATDNGDSVSGLVLVGPAYWMVSDYPKRLKSLMKIPSIIIVGSEDPHLPPKAIDELKGLIGSEEVAVIGKIHPCYLDDSEGFNSKVCEFLERIKNDAARR